MLSPLLIPSPSINIYCLAVFFSYFYWPHNHNTQQSSLSLLISIAHLPAPYLLESPPSSPHLPLPQPPHLLLTARLTNSHVYFLPLLPFPDGGGCCNQRVSLASGWGEEEGPSRAGERYCHSGHPPLSCRYVHLYLYLFLWGCWSLFFVSAAFLWRGCFFSRVGIGFLLLLVFGWIDNNSCYFSCNNVIDHGSC